jgi:secondary thiamine-phosphate synthase enzyme
MKQSQTELSVRTAGPGLYEITGRVAGWLAGQGVANGLLTLFCRHTSASLTIQENADEDVQHDLVRFFRRLVAEDRSLYRHSAEGADDMPAHIRSALTGVQLSVPVSDGRLALGTWQGIYVFEHRTRPHDRSVVLHLIGD